MKSAEVTSWKASSGFGESTAHALTRGMGWG